MNNFSHIFLNAFLTFLLFSLTILAFRLRAGLMRTGKSSVIWRKISIRGTTESVAFDGTSRAPSRNLWTFFFITNQRLIMQQVPQLKK